MKVILLQDIKKIGKKHEIKEVSDGYALNLLIPKGLVISATSPAIKQNDLLKSKILTMEKVHNELLDKNMSALSSVTLTIIGKVNEKGHLFAGLHKTDIAKALKSDAHIDIDPDSIVLDGTIKEIGEYNIVVNTAGKTAKFILIVKK